MEEYRVFEGKKLRYGYTTGTCAAAAAKAATEMLLTKQRVDYIKIDTPKGITLNLEVEDVTVARLRVTSHGESLVSRLFSGFAIGVN